MKTSIKIFALGIVLLGFSATSFAQVSANASATIIAPIGLANTDLTPLAFGNIIQDGVGGSIAVDVDNAVTLTTVKVPSVTGTRSAAKFTVTGLAASTYTITLPASTEISLGGLGVTKMTINNYVAKSTSGLRGFAVGGTIEAGGSEVFYVGGTLVVGATQLVGNYTGTFPVTVNY